MEKVILCKYGELILKGLNKSSFEAKLISNLKKSISKFGKFNVYTRQSTVYIEEIEGNIDNAYKAAQKVFGFVKVVMAYKCEKDMDMICKTTLEYMQDYTHNVKTFKVESKRSDKMFPLKSPQISAAVGEYILNNIETIKVDVYKPDIILNIEVRDYAAFVHKGNDEGAGGMPYGTNQKAMLLLSGGIDSPVAGYMTAKRGVFLECIHFFSYPYTGEQAKQKVLDLAEILSSFCGGEIVMHIVPFTKIQQEIKKHCNEEMFTLVMRWFMMKISAQIAKNRHAMALVTGESIGQVASQTLHALNVTDSAADMLVIRPLIAMDKKEVIEKAMKIGTFDTSILPYEDCCTVFTPRHPKTKPILSDVLAQVKRLDESELIAEAVENTQLMKIPD